MLRTKASKVVQVVHFLLAHAELDGSCSINAQLPLHVHFRKVRFREPSGRTAQTLSEVYLKDLPSRPFLKAIIKGPQWTACIDCAWKVFIRWFVGSS